MHAGVGSFTVTGMQATSDWRVNYAVVYLTAAGRLSRSVQKIESEHPGENCGDLWEEMRDNAVSCLFLASACLESYANELFADRDKVFPGVPAHAVGKIWDLSERSSPLVKLAIALGGVDTYRIHKMMAARVTTAR